ncbi:hypothetical protein ILYODFUR_035600 [Ilyodon furcidens]|uniref:SRCR domain-containing protein n=1 Tax=Ilyodon furcidens TaxID=33524 RepID=A0ABV0TF31_9TELE
MVLIAETTDFRTCRTGKSPFHCTTSADCEDLKGVVCSSDQGDELSLWGNLRITAQVSVLLNLPGCPPSLMLKSNSLCFFMTSLTHLPPQYSLGLSCVFFWLWTN